VGRSLRDRPTSVMQVSRQPAVLEASFSLGVLFND
jgi:hypothetical protein